MALSNQGVFVSFLFLVLIDKDVSTWTLDLPEIKKFTENNDYSQIETELDNIKEENLQNTQVDEKYSDTSNIRDLENDVDYNGKYAGNYEYQSYTEKKVHDIVHSGSAYLEGLNRAMERYGQLLNSCSFNFTDSTNTTMQSQNESPLNLTEASSNIQPSLTVCARAMASREHVRRLAALTLWASRELEEKVFAADNDESDERSPDREEEEKELLLRLAWFIDRLAQLTGFQPTHQHGASQSDNISPSLSAALSSRPLSEPTELLEHSETKHSSVKSVKKRSLDSPLVTIVNYYIKHKVWDGSNPTSATDARSEDFNVKNDITYVTNDLRDADVKTVKKRAVDYKTMLNRPGNQLDGFKNFAKGKGFIMQSVKTKTYIDKSSFNMKTISTA